MQVAAAVDVAVDFGRPPVAQVLDGVVGETQHLPVAEPLLVEVAVSGDELPVGRVDAVSVEVHRLAAQLARAALLADGELHVGVGAGLEVRRDHHRAPVALGERGLPVEMGGAPSVGEAAPDARAVGVAGERRGLPLDALELLHALERLLHGAGEEVDALVVLGYHGVAQVAHPLRAVHGGHQVLDRRGGDDQLRLAGAHVDAPEAVVFGEHHALARILSVAVVAVVGTRDEQARVVDGDRPFAVFAHRAHRIREMALLLRLPVHHDGAELPVADVVEDERVLRPRQPVGHRRLLEVPAPRGGDGDELVAVLGVDEAERARGAVRQLILEVGLENEGVAVVRAPGVDREVVREKVVVRARRERARLRELRKRLDPLLRAIRSSAAENRERKRA